MPIQLRIASPCEESWEAMKGDERARHCARCKLNVFNVKELTDQELRTLLMKTEGKVCGRIYQRKDGTVLTRDCPTGLARVRRKALAALAMAATLIVAVIGYRLNAARSCSDGGEGEGWFATVFEKRFIDARETLRDTRSFGPLINELFPLRPTFTMGKMIRVTPSASGAAP